MNTTDWNREEAINALADDELSPDARERLLERLQHDARLQNDLCDIRRLKDLLRHAYPEGPSLAMKAPARHWRRVAQVASLLLLIGASFLGGWLASSGRYMADGFQLADVEPDGNNVLLYIGESHPEKFKETLYKAEALLQTRAARGGAVYVVASAGGVDMLRAVDSPVAEQIRTLQARYPELHFVACNKTLFNLKKKGKSVRLVEGTEVAPSAVSFVVEHLQKGWTYVAI